MPSVTSAIPDTLLQLKARELADQGRLREAEALLASAESPSADPALLHTLAVIVTRQGDYPRARRLWRQLEQARPGDAEAERMIEAIENWQTRPAWIGYLPATAACAVIAILALVFWSRAGNVAPSDRPASIETIVTVPVTPVQTVQPATPTPARLTPTAVTPRPVAAPEPAPIVTFELPPAKPRR